MVNRYMITEPIVRDSLVAIGSVPGDACNIVLIGSTQIQIYAAHAGCLELARPAMDVDLLVPTFLSREQFMHLAGSHIYEGMRPYGLELVEDPSSVFKIENPESFCVHTQPLSADLKDDDRMGIQSVIDGAKRVAIPGLSSDTIYVPSSAATFYGRRRRALKIPVDGLPEYVQRAHRLAMEKDIGALGRQDLKPFREVTDGNDIESDWYKLNKSLHDMCLIARIFGPGTLKESFAP